MRRTILVLTLKSDSLAWSGDVAESRRGTSLLGARFTDVDFGRQVVASRRVLAREQQAIEPPPTRRANRIT